MIIRKWISVNLLVVVILSWLLSATHFVSSYAQEPTPTPDGMECATRAPDELWCMIPPMTAVATDTPTPQRPPVTPFVPTETPTAEVTATVTPTATPTVWVRVWKYFGYLPVVSVP